MKIVTDKRIPGLEEAIRSAHPEIETVALEGSAITAADVRDADALMVRTRTSVGRPLLEESRVRLVGSATIGTDHIDSEWCHKNGIRVVNAPGCNAPAVMQYVACSLNCSGFDPSTGVLGVVGKGHVGSLVTELYRKAGAKVLVCDPPRKEQGMTDEDYLPLETLLEECDALTFHVPYTTEGPHPTHHLLDRTPGRARHIVNSSRGDVIDTGTVTADRNYIIDTWPHEDDGKPLPERAIRLARIATPHIAGYSVEGKQRATRAMAEALNEEFGLEIPTDGLADYCYRIPPLAEVVKSFDPLPLSIALKRDPAKFEYLRNHHLRNEA